MFGISFGELFLTLVLFILFIPTKDIPKCLKSMAGFFSYLQSLYIKCKDELNQVLDEDVRQIQKEINLTLSEIEEEVRYIHDTSNKIVKNDSDDKKD